MDNYYPNWMPGPINAELDHAASILAEIGDLLYWDSVVAAVKPASEFADTGDGATQIAFANVFAGISMSKHLAADTAKRRARVVVDQIVEFPCESSTFAIGDYVTPTYDTDHLLDQSVTKTDDPLKAIGRVVKPYASATTTVKVRMRSRLLTAGIFSGEGAIAATSITGTDASLGIVGEAGAAGNGGAVAIAGGAGDSGLGGAVTVTGGAGNGANAGGALTLAGGVGGAGGAGGVAGLTGGAGTGAGAGAIAKLVGGAGGATNAAGGATQVTGGAGGGTGAGGAVTIAAGASGGGATGNGGAVTITGGAAASTNGNGGSVTLAPGALAGTGAPGSIALTGFTKMFVAQTIAMNDAAVVLTRVPGTPSGTLLTGNWLLVDAESGTTENLDLPPEVDMANAMLIIKNTGGETINLRNDAGGAVATIATGEIAIAHCDGTNWTVIQLIETT